MALGLEVVCSMETPVFYHGSNVEVSVLQIMVNGFYRDFGYGFYCTSLKGV